MLAGIVVALILAKWTLLIAVLGLAFLITIHEFGHFVFAKLSGMRVEKFYVGFPPAAWKRRRGETEYGIGLIPLGGFCKIWGMTAEDELVSQGSLFERTLDGVAAALDWAGGKGVGRHSSSVETPYLRVRRLSGGGSEEDSVLVTVSAYQYESGEMAEQASWLRAAAETGQPTTVGDHDAYLVVTKNVGKKRITGSLSWRCGNLAYRVGASRSWRPEVGDGEAEAAAVLTQLADTASRVSTAVAAAGLCEPLGARAYYDRPVRLRNLTIFAGPLFNILAAVVILFVFLIAQGVVKPTLKIDTVAATVQVGTVQQPTPAAQAGLKPGDTLVGATVLTTPRGGIQRWKTWDEALKFLQSNPNTRIELAFRTPDGRMHTRDLKLAISPNTPTNSAPQGFLGVTAGQEWVRQAPWTAAWLAVKDTGSVVKSTFQGFYWLATGKVSVTGREGAAGPVGIISISSNSVRQGFYPALLALISVNLGILNLIPILPFDGGHIFFNTLERIRGRKIDRRVMERAAAVGVALLLFLFVFLTYNDIRRLFGG